MTRLTYDSDGRVATAVADPGAAEFDARYAWRPDGRPAMGIYTGFLASYGYQYDAGGATYRQATTTMASTSSAPNWPTMRRAGWCGSTSRGQAPEEGSPFAPTVRSHYRWEAAACQPLVVPGEPPSIENAMAGLVSADNVTFGCAP